jgi:Rhodanese-like domain
MLGLTLTLLLAAGPVPAPTASPTPYPVDPGTGRALGAKQMTPAALAELARRHHGVLIVDVRDEASFRKETIPGAVHVPLERLREFLKDLPRTTTLAFT